MLDIYGASWAGNWGFCPISEAEVRRLAADLKSVIDPGLFVLFHCGDVPAGGMLSLPDFAPLLRALKGSIGIGAPWHWLRTRAARAGGCRMLLFGVKPEYRFRGLPFLVLDVMFECARGRPALKWAEGSWTLEDNEQINGIIEDFGGTLDKRYRIYRRDIERD
jgi:GNAT superfamily N-acetyltransferase